MPRERRVLPPLTALPAFEASARLLSFTRAAEELYVSQAAISRHIRVLEENLGTRLFERAHRRISLTADGQRFQHAIAVALDLVGNAARDARGQVSGTGLTIAADLSMAHLWLLPRFSSFRAEFPEIDVNVLASEREADCLKEGIDLALLYGSGTWPGFDAHLLVREEIFPVCSPDYLRRHGAITELADIFRGDLLDLRGDRWDWVDWRQWLTEVGTAVPDNAQFIAFNNLPLLVQAACRGQGVGLGWGSLVDDLVEDGVLVKPLDLSIRTGRGYYVIKRADVAMSPETKVLFDWVVRRGQSEA